MWNTRGIEIRLTPEQEQTIESGIRQGLFLSPDQAADQAFQLLREVNAEDGSARLWIQRKVERALQEVARGELLEAETAWAELDAELERLPEA